MLKKLFLLIVLVSNFYGLNAQEAIQLISYDSKNQQHLYDLNIDRFLNDASVNGHFEILLPVENGLKAIHLEPVRLLSPDYSLFTSSGKQIDSKNRFLFYQGTIENDPTAKVALTIVDQETVHLSIFDKDGHFELYPDMNYQYVGTTVTTIKNDPQENWTCTYIDPKDEQIDERSLINSNRNSIDEDTSCVTVFIEVDHNMYNKKGSISATENWAVALMNQVNILYIEWNVPLTISGIQVWDTPDPYLAANNTSQALSIFRTEVHNNPNFNGRLAHLFSGRSLGGGIAYLNSLCSNFSNIAVSANLRTSVTPYPTYSWNVMVIAHELGHNFGSRHTHDCVWNGDNTAIDGCYTTSGSCPQPPVPSGGGTIMSYCHLTGAGINLSKGFGDQPGSLIQDRYFNANCTTGENCVPVPPFNDVCARATEIGIYNHCIEWTYSTRNATPSEQGEENECGDTDLNEDVWYYFTYPENSDTVELTISSVDSQNIEFVVEMYTGTCGALQIDTCITIANQSHQIVLTDVNYQGTEIFLRISENDMDQAAMYSICIFDESLPCYESIDSLVLLYTTLGGSQWTNQDGWLEGFQNGACDYCNWYGISCDQYGNIKRIDLSSNNLTGIFTSTLSPLYDLEALVLNDNSIQGLLPQLSPLFNSLKTLDLRSNDFQDTIPNLYFLLDELNALHLDSNLIFGPLPDVYIQAPLQVFTASNNQLSGCFSDGLSTMCYRDSINLLNNPDLVYGGDVTLLCEEGYGTDYDDDSFCNGIEDCNDNDPDINPLADEVLCDGQDNNCDGSIDEGSDFGPNIWVGPDSLGVWDDSNNWSMGHFPLICEEVEIGTAGDTIYLDFLSEQYISLRLKSLNVGMNTNLTLDTTIFMDIVNSGSFTNYGNLLVQGGIGMYNEMPPDTNFINHGTIHLEPTGGIYINEIKEVGLYNGENGHIITNGNVYISNYNYENPLYGIINYGSMDVNSFLNISGTFSEQFILLGENAQMKILQSGQVNTYNNE